MKKLLIMLLIGSMFMIPINAAEITYPGQYISHEDAVYVNNVNKYDGFTSILIPDSNSSFNNLKGRGLYWNNQAKSTNNVRWIYDSMDDVNSLCWVVHFYISNDTISDLIFSLPTQYTDDSSATYLTVLHITNNRIYPYYYEGSDELASVKGDYTFIYNMNFTKKRSHMKLYKDNEILLNKSSDPKYEYLMKFDNIKNITLRATINSFSNEFNVLFYGTDILKNNTNNIYVYDNKVMTYSYDDLDTFIATYNENNLESVELKSLHAGIYNNNDTRRYFNWDLDTLKPKEINI